MEKLYKYQGAGNDFVLLDARGTDKRYSEEKIRRICDRRFGIGGDGFMSLEDDKYADFYMRYYNADGREGTMCGNGGRCIALFAYHLGAVGGEMRFNSSDGLHDADIIAENCTTGTVRLKMIDVEEYETFEDGLLLFTGSPHFIKFVDDVHEVDVFKEGRVLRYSERFSPDGANVNFVQFVEPGVIKVRTYERGVEDETLACGTGAVASAMASKINYGGGNVWRVSVEGGELEVRFEENGNNGFRNVYLTGPAEKVFEAVY
ncbi:MAG: diaminopimelate epimerase [Rikenellaceae bacterium]|nr:diaminopimelate epimerase [Rikenellaceae bacterium]